MASAQFKLALTFTGYIDSNGKAAPGLARSERLGSARLRPAFRNDRVGLNADAVFSVQGTPTAIFKDAGLAMPSEHQMRGWHEAAWNLGIAPLLWIITPTDIRLYDCYASPPRGGDITISRPIDRFALDTTERLRSLDSMCGRLATETGAFWSSEIGKRIDRRYRVDRELLNEIRALETSLTALPPSTASRLEGRDEVNASRDFAQRLVGRCIFTWYLLDRGIAKRFLPKKMPADLSKLFSTTNSAFALFKWLRKTFNGDLFPMDNPGEELERLSDAHLALIRDFAEGRSVITKTLGQGRLFKFRFDAIPIDLVSSIYQQFARSSAEDDSHLQGLHYTPIEVVHLTLDPVFEKLPKSARVIDPACGSGAFLVEAFRRLVWKANSGKPVKRATVRHILYNQLFGIDINRSALGIAAFSLYLAALEFDEEPILDAADLKFDRLIGTTLFNADTINDELPKEVTQRTFDAVVGNPPWTFDSRNSVRPRKIGDDESARPRRSPDQAFLNVGAQLAGNSGRIGMVMKATPFFSRDQHAINSRNALFRKLKPVALVNMSALRKEDLFPDATGPALLFFARCALANQIERILVGSLPWSPDFRRNGMFQVGSGELRTFPLARILRTPAILKATTFGTIRDGWLIEKLENEFPTLDQVLTGAGLLPKAERGQGFQVNGTQNSPPASYYNLGVVTPDNYEPFRIDPSHLDRFNHPTLHRPREPDIFRGPLLLCPKASYKAAVQRGRYSSSVSTKDTLYTESFYGISFAGHAKELAFSLSAILNSSLTTFQLAFGGGAWGLERSTVEPKDLLSIRVPNIFSGASLDELVKAEAMAALAGGDMKSLIAMDRAVFNFYELEADEELLADDSIERSRMLIYEGQEERKRFVRPPTIDMLNAYAASTVRVVNRFLRARGERHLEATTYSRQLLQANWNEDSSGLTAIRFSMATGKPTEYSVVRHREEADLGEIANLLKLKLHSNIAPYVNEKRLLRVYLEDDLFILKPSETRYWTRTSGLNDADIILGDHWLGDPHAAKE